MAIEIPKLPVNIEHELAEIAAQAGSGFKAHFSVYLTTGIGLVILNILTTPFPWAFFPLAGWGVGVIAHLQSIFNRRNKKIKRAAVQNYPPELQGLVAKLSAIEGAWKQHRNVYFAVNAFLFGINLITSFVFPWFLFPLCGWGIGFMAHRGSSKARQKYIRKQLAGQGIDWYKLGRGTLAGPASEPVTIKQQATGLTGGTYSREANTIKENMIEELKHNEELKSHWGGELETLLNRFTGQIAELENMNNELESAIRTTDEADLKSDLQNLESKLPTTRDEALKREYNKSIAQYRHQLHTIEDVKNKQEIVQLRLKSSLMLIKQLKLDSARLKNLKSVEEPLSLKEIREKTGELSQYLEDFNKGYGDLE